MEVLPRLLASNVTIPIEVVYVPMEVELFVVTVWW